MDFKLTKPDGEDVDMDVSTVFSNIYSSCDTENTNAVCVSRLIEFIHPYMMEDLEALEELRENLDPENKDILISGQVFKEQIFRWSKKLAGSSEEETDFNRTPSRLSTIDDRELPYLHSTPRPSLGDKLLRCKDLLNLSNVSGYSLSTSRLDATNNEEEIKRLQHQLSKTMNELTMVKNQLASSEEANEVMQNDIERLNRRLLSEQQVNEHLQKVKLYNDELRDEINGCRKTIENFKKKLSNSEKEMQELKNAFKDLEEEKMKADKKAEHFSRQKLDILKENYEFKTEIDSYEKQIADIKRINDELKTKYTEQKDLIDQLRDENDLLNHQKQTLEKALKGNVSSSPLEQDSPSPPLGNVTLNTQNNGTAFNFPPPPSSLRRKSKLPLLKNMLVKKTSSNMLPSSTPLETTSPKPHGLDSISSDCFSPIDQNSTKYQMCVGATNYSQNSSEEDIHWKIFNSSKNSSGSGQNLGESLQNELCKVNPTFQNNSTALFENHEQMFALEDEINNLKKSLKDLQAENNKLIKELKEKTTAHEDLVNSNFILANNLETTKSKVDHLKDLLSEKDNDKIENILKLSKGVQVGSCEDDIKKVVTDLQHKVEKTLQDGNKCSEQTAEMMREFGQLTTEKIEIETKLLLLQIEKEKCEQKFIIEISTIEEKLIEQENTVTKLNNLLSVVVQENERLLSIKTNLEEDVFCHKNDLDVMKEKNQQLLQRANKKEEDYNKQEQEYQCCIKDFVEKIKFYEDQITNNEKEFDLQLKEELEKIKLEYDEKINLTKQENTSLDLEKETKSNMEQQLETIKQKNKELLKTIGGIKDEHNFKQVELYSYINDCKKKMDSQEGEILKLKTDIEDLNAQLQTKYDETNNIKDTLEKEMKKGSDMEFQLKQKEQEIVVLKETIEKDSKIFKEEINKNKKYLEQILKDKDQEINSLKDSLSKSLKYDLENQLRLEFEQKINLKEEETNLKLKENLIKQLRTEYEEKIKLEKGQFEENLKVKDEEITQFKENLEKRLICEFEEKLKRSIDGEEKMFALGTKCESLEKSLVNALKNCRSKASTCEELEKNLKSTKKELKQLNTAKEKLDTKIKSLESAKEKLVLEKLSIKEQLLEQQRIMSKLKEECFNSEKEHKLQCNLFEHTISELQSSITRLSEQLTNKKNTLEKVNIEMGEKLFLYNNDLECLKTNNEHLKLQIIDLQNSKAEELEILKQDYDSETERLKSEFEKKILVQNQEFKDINLALNEKIRKLMEAEKKIAYLTEKCASLEKDLNSTLHNLYDKTDLCEKVSADWQSVECELKAMFATKLDLEQKVFSLTDQVAKLTEEKSCFEKIKESLHDETVALSEKLEERESSIQYLQSNIGNLENDIDTLRSKNTNLVDINNNQCQEIDSLRSLIDKERNLNKHEIEELKALLEERTNQLEFKDQAITKISVKLEETKLLLTNVEKENSELLKSISDLRSRNLSKEKNLDSLNLALTETKLLLNDIESQNSKLLKLVSDLKTRNLAKEKDLESLNFALEAERTKTSMFSGEIALKDQEIKKISNQLAELKSLLQKSENAYQTLLSDVENKEHQNICLKQELIQLKSGGTKLEASKSTDSLLRPTEKKPSFSKQQIALERIKERLESAESELKIEKRKNNELSAEIEVLKISLQEQKIDKSSLEDIIDDLTSRLNCEIETLSEQNKKLQEELSNSNDLKKSELLEVKEQITKAKDELSSIQGKVTDCKGKLEEAKEDLLVTQENVVRAKEELSSNSEARTKNKFTLLGGPHLDSSRPSSPDSPSNDFEVNGLPDRKVFYQSSNYSLPESAVIDIPNLVFSDVSDEFLEEIGLTEKSPRKTLSKEDAEKRVTSLALRLFVNSKDVDQRFQNQKAKYKSKFEEFLSLTSDISYRLRDHVCIGTNEPISPVFVLLEELKLRAKALAQSATDIGILAYESRMRRCWNLVTNYMAILRRENEALHDSATNVESTTSQTLRRKLVNTSSGDEPDVARPVRRRGLAAKCQYAIYTIGAAAFVVAAVIFLHLHCRLTVSDNQSCPLDEFITRQVTGIPPM